MRNSVVKVAMIAIVFGMEFNPTATHSAEIINKDQINSLEIDSVSTNYSGDVVAIKFRKEFETIFLLADLNTKKTIFLVDKDKTIQYDSQFILSKSNDTIYAVRRSERYFPHPSIVAIDFKSSRARVIYDDSFNLRSINLNKDDSKLVFLKSVQFKSKKRDAFVSEKMKYGQFVPDFSGSERFYAVASFEIINSKLEILSDIIFENPTFLLVNQRHGYIQAFGEHRYDLKSISSFISDDRSSLIEADLSKIFNHSAAAHDSSVITDYKDLDAVPEARTGGIPLPFVFSLNEFNTSVPSLKLLRPEVLSSNSKFSALGVDGKVSIHSTQELLSQSNYYSSKLLLAHSELQTSADGNSILIARRDAALNCLFKLEPRPLPVCWGVDDLSTHKHATLARAGDFIVTAELQRKLNLEICRYGWSKVLIRCVNFAINIKNSPQMKKITYSNAAVAPNSEKF